MITAIIFTVHNTVCLYLKYWVHIKMVGDACWHLIKIRTPQERGKREDLVTGECFFTENSIIATFPLCSWASLESNSGQNSIFGLPFMQEAAIGNDDDDHVIIIMPLILL